MSLLRVPPVARHMVQAALLDCTQLATADQVGLVVAHPSVKAATKFSLLIDRLPRLGKTTDSHSSLLLLPHQSFPPPCCYS